LWRTSQRAIALLLLALTVGSATAFAQVPVDNQAKLVLRILSFDQKLVERAEGELRIAVIYRPGSDESERAQREMAAELETLAKKQSVAKLNVKVVPLAFSGSLQSDLDRNKISAAYVCPGMETELGAISKAARAAGALTFSGVEQFARNGLAVALVRRDSKIGIVVNLPASRAEGADLHAGLLNVAEVLR
jgi:hypothetical protein